MKQSPDEPWQGCEGFHRRREKTAPVRPIIKGTGRDIGPVVQAGLGFGSPEYYAPGTGSGPRASCQMSVCASLFGGWFTRLFPSTFPKGTGTLHASSGCSVWGSIPCIESDGFLGVGFWTAGSGSRLVVWTQKTLGSRQGRCSLRLKPGTDGAMAMAFLARMAGTGRWNRAFAGEWVSGAGAAMDAAREWSTSRASRECGVSEDAILQGADLWLDSPPGALQWGVSVDMSRSALGTAHALASLVILSGNLDVPGGCVVTTDPFGIARRGGMKQPPGKTGSSRYPMTEKGFPYASSDVLLEEMETGREVASPGCRETGPY